MALDTDHAVVLGGSLGGLLAARVLSEAFAHVTVIERDVLDTAPVSRRSVPQGRHAHALLARGREALEELFPGLTDELVAQGVPKMDFQSGFRWFNDGRLMCQQPSGLIGLGVSRPLLEARIRARVFALPNVTVADGCEVSALTGSTDARRVTGARVLRLGDERTEETLEADLVVDATGRGARGTKWLEDLGHPAPAADRVEVGLAYATRFYRRAQDAPQPAAVAMAVSHPRGGAMLAQEEDRWIVTFGGILGDATPLDHEGFTAFAATLASPAIHDVIRDAEPLSDPLRFRYPASVRRRYERLPYVPDGFLAFGDSITSFSPVYGQGMSVAALEALELRACLQDGPDQLARRFFKTAAAVIDIPWSIGVGSDLRFPGVKGRRTTQVRIINAYLKRLHVAAEQDPTVARAFLRVINLMDPPQRVMRPPIALRVLRGSRRGTYPAPKSVSNRAAPSSTTKS